MDKSKVIFCYTDDWQGVYIDGELIEEGHHVGDCKYWFELGQVYLNSELKMYEVDYDWTSDVGSFPKYFIDFPEGVLT